MIKAVATTRDGRTLLILGLSDENLDRMIGDQPIHFDVRELKLPEGVAIQEILIFSRGTEDECYAALQGLMKLGATRTVVMPRGPEQPQ